MMFAAILPFFMCHFAMVYELRLCGSCVVWQVDKYWLLTWEISITSNEEKEMNRQVSMQRENNKDRGGKSEVRIDSHYITQPLLIFITPINKSSQFTQSPLKIIRGI